MYVFTKAIGRIPSRKQAFTNEHEFASLLLWAGLVEVRELGLFVVLDLLVLLVHVVIPGQGLVGGLKFRFASLFIRAGSSPLMQLCHYRQRGILRDSGRQ